MASKKAQGATEYLVIFAVVLIVVMVAVGLLSSMPSIFGEAKASASTIYWSSLKPLQLAGWSIQSDGNVSLALQNSGIGQLTLTGVSLSRNSDLSNSDYSGLLALQVQTGRSTTYMGAPLLSVSNRCSTGSSFEYYVNLTYTLGGQAQSFTGSKPIVGRCG